MSIHEHYLSLPYVVAYSALTALQRWARERPTQIALRHRRLGAWKAWRWIDVLREVERVADGLRQQGFTPGARLALSGAFEPSLLMLAAHQLGGQSLVIGRDSRGDELQRQLRQARPTFAFVQRREDVSHWLGSGLVELWPLRLFSAQANAVSNGLWQVQPLSVLFVGEAPVAQRQGWAQVAEEDVLWVDEGTEWRGGLGHLLSRWLEQGEGLAFPETSESAGRDRREIAPTGLLLSAARVEALAGEIDARLAPPGSWRWRLCDWTLENPHQGLRRWLKQRVRRLLGFHRLRRIEVPSAPASVALQGPARLSWLHEYLERAA
ncbi:AMP-binding protein [Pseudomonas sp. NPDC089743]|uniref:AMP-binding protein n=1 Tax=Pseudomonas sp. NPDC089743 TaxID=3364471 RepID=UPI00382B83F1